MNVVPGISGVFTLLWATVTSFLFGKTKPERSGHIKLFNTVIFFLFLTNASAQEVPVFEWAKAMGGTSDDRGQSIAIDASGNVLTTGYFRGTSDFDPSAATFNLTSAGSDDILISKLDASGNFVWAKQLGGTGIDQGYSITADASGNVFTTGYFTGTGDFDPGAGTFNLTSAGSNDIFISKLDASGNFVWAKQLGGTLFERGNSITIDASGNVLTSGWFQGTVDFDPGTGSFNLTSPGSTDVDIFISKLDASGNFVWAKQLGGTGNDEGYSIATDASGNVFTTGKFEGTGDFDPGAATFNLTSAGNYDIFISKLDASGNFAWAKQLGGTSEDVGYSIAIDASGNVLTTGTFSGTVDFDPGTGAFNLTPAGPADIFISKVDAAGNFVWAKRFGGTSGEFSTSITIDAAGNVFTTGGFSGTSDFDPGTGVFNLAGDINGNIFISKLDASGNFVWAIQMGGTDYDEGYSIATDAEGNVFTTGLFQGTADFDPGACTYDLVSAGAEDIFVQKLSPSPTITSFSPASGPIGTSVTITGTNFSTTPANNVVIFFNNQTATVTASTATSITTTVPAGAITGRISVTVNCVTVQSATDFTIGATSAVPVFEWAKAITGDGRGNSIAIDASGNVFTTGYFFGTADFDPGAGTFNLTSAGNDDIFISKVDVSGNFVWAKRLGGTGTDWGHSIAIDASGNVLTTGRFSSGAVDFDPGAGTFNLTSAGGFDGFISKLDASGNFVWAKQLGGTDSDISYSIAIDASENVLTTGQFFGTSDFDPGTGTFNLTSAGIANGFISKLDASGNFVWAKQLGGSDNFGLSIAIDGSGNVLTTGGFSGTGDFDPGTGTFNLTSAGSYDIFISELDASGNFVWAKQLGGTGYDEGRSIKSDEGGNVFTTGAFSGVGDFDPGTGTFNLTSAGNTDIFISKVNSSGNFVWAKQAGGTGEDVSYSIVIDASGNVFATGFFRATVDFDPGAGTSNLTSAGGEDIFIANLNSSGNFVWAIQLGGTDNDRSHSIAIDASGNVFTTGLFRVTVDFDPGACTYNLVSAGAEDFFVQKLSIGTAALPTITSFSPASGPIGTSVTITGTNFSTTPANNDVKFFNNQTATVTASTATSITTTVPAGTITGKISVTVNCNTVQSATDFTVGAPTLPTITSFTPTNGPIGTTVTITGTNFSATPANNIVYFGATQATVTAATTIQLTVITPIGATYQPIAVTVNGLTAYSSTPFVVTFADGGIIDACSFAAKVDFTSGTQAYDVALGDLDGDGKADMVGANYGSNSISVFRNTSTAGTISTSSFATKVDFTTGTNPFGVALGDMDGDGKLDIVVSNYTSNSISVFRNTSNPGSITSGSFSTKVDFVTDIGPYWVAVHDLDGDGKTDIAVTNYNGGNSISILRNTSTMGIIDASSFSAKVDLNTPSYPSGLSISDMDGDGKPDLIETNYINSSVGVFRNISTPGVIVVGSFAARVDFGTGVSPGHVAAGNLDSDLKPELVVTNWSDGTVSVLKNTSTPGTIAFDLKVDFTTGLEPRGVGINDLDGDGSLDLAVVTQAEGKVSLLKNTSSATISFATRVAFTVGNNPRAVAIGDVDGDGKPEVAVANYSGNSVSVLRNENTCPPTITSFAPSSGPVGTTVTITGTNFSTTPGNNTVQFNGTVATVTASTATSITTTVPAGATTGVITVTVAGNTATSATNFTVTTPVITISQHPVPSTVCAGAIAAFSTAATGTTNITYQWQFSTTLTGTYNDIANGGGYSNVTTASLSVNTTGNFGVGFYRAKVNGDLAATVFSNAAELTVNVVPPIPTIGTTNLGCAPASTTLIPTGASAGEQYKFFDVATGGSPLSSGLSFTTPSLTVSTTYHISTYNTTTLCESTRVPAVVNVQSCNPPVVETTTTIAFIEGIVTIDLQELISDQDNNLDLSTLQIITQPTSGAPASLSGFILTIDYTGLPFPGTDNVEIEICDLTGICTQQELTIELEGDIEVFNAFSPNNDSQNDFFFIQYIELFPDTENNHVTIYNRWGDEVFSISNYNNDDRVFRGISNSGKELATGTYFYKIEFSSGRAMKTGYLSLKR